MTEPWEFGDAAEETPSFPWPPGEDDPVLTRFGETWRTATFDPGSFFRRLPREGGTGSAILYYVVIGVLVAGATLFWESLALYSGTGSGLANELGLQPTNPVVGFLLTPAILVGMLFVAAAATHMLLSLFDGVRHGFGTTIRVFAYAYSPGIFGVIPWVGGMVGSVWMVVLLIIGLREAHETEGWKTAVAVLVPLILLLGVMVVSVMVVMAAGAALLGTG
jgi:hypothetical protein